MPKPYKHLSRDERVQIAVWLGQHLSLREIARRLGRAPSTLSRELRREDYEQRTPAAISREARQRWSQSRRRKRLKTPQLRRQVRRMLTQGLSPELIAGRLRQQGEPVTVSHEAIYQWIYQDAPELIDCLVRAHPQRRSRHYHRKRRFRIAQRRLISERPASVEQRQEAGHWEVDTVFSRRHGAILAVACERKTRYLRIRLLKRKSAEGLCRMLIDTLGSYRRDLVRTLTYDNGSENTKHLEVNEALGTSSYFCHPYHSWEKGTVENSIGLIRRYFPRGTNFVDISDAEVRQVEKQLNERPRKCLDYRTPEEAFRAECCT